MKQEIKEKAEMLLEHPVAKNLGLDMDTVTSIMESPVGQALMSQLKGAKGVEIKKAASEAADGDMAAAESMLSSLMQSKEGQDLAQQVMDIKGQSDGRLELINALKPYLRPERQSKMNKAAQAIGLAKALRQGGDLFGGGSDV